MTRVVASLSPPGYGMYILSFYTKTQKLDYFS